MRIKIYLLILTFLLLAKIQSVRAQEKFDYPDNFRHYREMILEDNHYKTMEDADRDVYKFFFKEGEVFKKRTHPEKVTPRDRKKKVEFKEPMNLWQIVLDNLKPKNIFDFYTLTDQLNTPQRLAAAASIGYLMDMDRYVYAEWDKQMRRSKFWDNNGSWLSSSCDGFAEVGIAGVLSLTGNKKNQQVAQMLMESALGLRVIYIKRILGVTRPSELISNIGPSFNFDSMPSGHTWVAFSMATILGEAYNIKWLMYPLAAMSGLSRIQQNTHWPSDIVAGGLLGHLEARKILARHGYLDSTEIAESRIWNNTRVDVDGGLRVFYDSYANMESKDPILDRVGRLVWRWRVSQRISPSILFQANYHWRGQIPSIVNYNSAEDVLMDPRLAVKLGDRLAFLAGYTYSKVQFQDLGTSYHHPDRAELPEGLNYAKTFKQYDVNLGFIYRLSKDYYIKPEYKSYNADYWHYGDLDSRGGFGSVEIGTSPEKDHPTKAVLSYGAGYENADNAAYNFDRNVIRAKVTQNLGNHFVLKGSYLREYRDYKNWRGGYKADGTWQVAGVELSRNFNDSWNGEIGYYRRSLDSSIPGWPYKKDLYIVQVENRF